MKTKLIRIAPASHMSAADKPKPEEPIPPLVKPSGGTTGGLAFLAELEGGLAH